MKLRWRLGQRNLEHFDRFRKFGAAATWDAGNLTNYPGYAKYPEASQRPQNCHRYSPQADSYGLIMSHCRCTQMKLTILMDFDDFWSRLFQEHS